MAHIKGKTLAIDFDGVIHDYKKVEWPLFGEPVIDSQPTLMKLRRLHNKIIIFSSRAHDLQARQMIGAWLEQHHIPYDEITNVKGSADYFIDDRAIHFENWVQVMGEL